MFGKINPIPIDNRINRCLLLESLHCAMLKPDETWWILVFPARFSRWLWPPTAAQRHCWTPPAATSAARHCISQRSRATSRRVAGCWRLGRKPRRSLARCAAQGVGAALGMGWLGNWPSRCADAVMKRWSIPDWKLGGFHWMTFHIFMTFPFGVVYDVFFMGQGSWHGVMRWLLRLLFICLIWLGRAGGTNIISYYCISYHRIYINGPFMGLHNGMQHLYRRSWWWVTFFKIRKRARFFEV